MSNKAGSRKWFPVETVNMLSEQIGFDIVTASYGDTRDFQIFEVEEGFCWVAIHNINTHNSEIQAASSPDIAGDDLSLDSKFELTGISLVGGDWITVYPEDIIYGKFTKFALKKPIELGTTDYIKLVRGVYET